MMRTATCPLVSILLAGAFTLGAAGIVFAQSSEHPTREHRAHVSTSKTSAASQQQETSRCWIGVDDEHGYGYYGKCGEPHARQAR